MIAVSKTSIASAVMAMFLVACSSVGEMRANVTPVAQSLFRFSDLRPSEAKQSLSERVGSTLVKHSLGDDRVHPPFPVLLETRLFHAKGERMRGMQIEISKADVRVYQRTGVDKTGSLDRQAFIPPGTNPAYAGMGIVLADLLDIGFAEKRIEIELEGKVNGQPISASEYGAYTFGSPEKLVLELMDKTIAKFSDQIH